MRVRFCWSPFLLEVEEADGGEKNDRRDERKMFHEMESGWHSAERPGVSLGRSELIFSGDPVVRMLIDGEVVFCGLSLAARRAMALPVSMS